MRIINTLGRLVSATVPQKFSNGSLEPYQKELFDKQFSGVLKQKRLKQQSWKQLQSVVGVCKLIRKFFKMNFCLNVWVLKLTP